MGKTMKKLLSVALSAAMLCMLLSGCVYEGISVDVHEDGSGKLAVKAGFSEEFMKSMAEEQEDGGASLEAQLAEMEKFEVDGKTYYGVTDERLFDSAEAFNTLFVEMNENTEKTMGSGTGISPLHMEKNEDGVTLAMDNRGEQTEAPEESEETDGPSYEADKEETARRAEQIEQVYRQRTVGFAAADLKKLAEDEAEMLTFFSPEEFEEYLKDLRARDAAELTKELKSSLEWSKWEGVKDAERKTREADVAKVLRASALKLSETQVTTYAKQLVDHYDYPPIAFQDKLDELKGYDEDSMKSELEWMDTVYSEEETDGEETGADNDSDSDASLEELEAMADDAVMQLTARFDVPVTQIAGPAEGVSIEGNTLTLDLTQMSKEVYRFTTRKNVALAYDSTQTIELDGKSVELRCYALRDAKGGVTNYVRVRDVASLLNGTAAQFGVGWDGAVKLTRGGEYADNVDQVPFTGVRTYRQSVAKTLVDGKDAALDSLLLSDEEGGGYTYYKLRDLGSALSFNVRWDAARHLICVESGKPYTG